MDSWKSSPWYHPELDKDSSRARIQSKPKGTFMVTDDPVGYCLWIRGGDMDNVYRFLLKRVGNDNRVQLGKKIFSNPAGVIGVVSQTPLRYNNLVLALVQPYVSDASVRGPMGTAQNGSTTSASRRTSNTLPPTGTSFQGNTGAVKMDTDVYLVQLTHSEDANIGMQLESMHSQRPDGAVSWRHCVSFLDENGAAARCGIFLRDFVLEVNGKSTSALANAAVQYLLVQCHCYFYLCT